MIKDRKTAKPTETSQSERCMLLGMSRFIPVLCAENGVKMPAGTQPGEREKLW